MAPLSSRKKVTSGKSSFKKIGLLAKIESPISLSCLKRLLPIFKKYAERPETKIYIDEAISSLLPKNSFFTSASPEAMAASCELFLSVGGDGTLLRAARHLLETEGWKTSALLGINTGRLGFLTLLGSEEAS